MHTLTDTAATRTLTDTMRAMIRESQGSYARAGLTAGVTLTRAYGRRRYMLTYGNSTRSGHSVMLDATERTLWIRPAARPSWEGDPVHAIAVRTAAETLLLDALMSDALEAGYTLSKWSETPESLAEWRAARAAYLSGVTLAGVRIK